MPRVAPGGNRGALLVDRSPRAALARARWGWRSLRLAPGGDVSLRGGTDLWFGCRRLRLRHPIRDAICAATAGPPV